MNFSNIIFPEIVHGKRGPKEAIELLQMVAENVKIDSDKHELILSEKLKSFNDVNVIRHCALVKLCSSKPYKIYHLGRDFLHALASIDRDIPFDKLPEEFCAYINFPPHGLNDGADWVSGGYIYIGRKWKIIDPKNDDSTVILMTYVTEIVGNGDYKSANFFIKISEHESFKKSLENNQPIDSCIGFYRKPDKETIETRNIIWRTLLNTVLYIHSQDPKLERVSPYRDISKQYSKKDLRRQNRVISECTMPIVFVHRLYERQRIFHKDSTWVITHPRWQRCGPELSQIKLIWVQEHERHFKQIIEEVKDGNNNQ